MSAAGSHLAELQQRVGEVHWGWGESQQGVGFLQRIEHQKKIHCIPFYFNIPLVIVDLYWFMVRYFSLYLSPRPCSTQTLPPAALQDLREKREELNRQILKEEEDKAKIQKEPWHPTCKACGRYLWLGPSFFFFKLDHDNIVHIYIYIYIICCVCICNTRYGLGIVWGCVRVWLEFRD